MILINKSADIRKIGGKANTLFRLNIKNTASYPFG